MTQYEELKLYIKDHPGTTRTTIEKQMRNITHAHELLNRLIESGDGYRERVEGKTKRGCWGYFLCP